MTAIPTSATGDRVSIRAEEPTSDVGDPAEPTPAPGPGSVFVVLGAVLTGLAAAFAFQSLSPDTPLVILGGTLFVALILGVVGLYRYQWFLLISLAIRPALDDLIADQFGTFQPSAILGILAIGVTALHLISRKLSGNWQPLTPLGYAFLGFFLLFIPSFVTSVDRGVSQTAMFGLASVVLLYIAIEQHLLDDRKFLLQLLVATGVSSIVPMITGFVQFFVTGTLDPGGSGLIRIDGSFAHPNTFATYLTLILLVAVSLIPTVEAKYKLVVMTAAGLGGFLLIMTFARGAWASFLIGSLALAARINRKFVLAIIAGSSAIAIVVPGVRERLTNLTATTGANGGVKTDDSLAWRIDYWERITPFFERNPLTGIGIDATKTQTIEAKDPHNSLLQAFLEGGFVGGAGFVILLCVATYAGFQTWRKARRNVLDFRTKLISVGAMAGLLSVAAQLLTENVLLNTIVWWYLNIALAHLAVLTWGTGRRTVDDQTPTRFEQRALPAGPPYEPVEGRR